MNKIKAAVFDQDGTISIIHNRSPYDGSKCGQDLPNEPVIFFLRKTYEEGINIIICSGRSEDHRSETSQWLQENNVPYHALLMRPSKDNRKDTIIKQEIYDNEIKDKYDVLFVVDDRPVVIRMWKANGLFVFNVGDSVEF